MVAALRVRVDHYVENRERYGKTLVFAIDIQHAALLADAFRASGVRAGYVASRRPDGDGVSAAAVLEAFRDGELEVLVNVLMLTEGVDVPSIETVFLTRPTNSETLLRQMIGRGLRGPKMKGTDEVWLVSFEDHWERFRDWLSPLALVSDVVEASEEPSAPVSRKPALHDVLPWDMVREIAARLHALPVEQKADAFDAVSHGSYVLEYESDDEGGRRILPVYEHQHGCWEALFDELDRRRARGVAILETDVTIRKGGGATIFTANRG